MRAIATAHHDRSLDGFETTLKTYEHELSQDAIIQAHLSDLYTTMLEQNLGRLIEPFSRVEIAHLAGLMKLDAKIVEATLSRMVLDHKLAAILDQGMESRCAGSQVASYPHVLFRRRCWVPNCV